MGKHEDADLILKLYDLRREPVMREARNWFITFSPETAADYMDAIMGPNSAYLRMVVSYWEMAATLVNNGAIDEQMFHDTNGEHMVVFAKLEPVLADIRKQWDSPEMLKNFEALVRRVPDNEKKLAEIRERFKMIMAMIAERTAKAQAAGQS
jgi:hypothetical protein